MNTDPISLWVCVPTAQNPPHSHLFALCWCPHTQGRFIVCLSLQLCPVPSPSSVCATAFPFEVFHTAPSLSCLMCKSSCNAASETQIFKTSGHLSLWLLGKCQLLFQDTKTLVLCGKSGCQTEVPYTEACVRCCLECFCLAWFG